MHYSTAYLCVLPNVSQGSVKIVNDHDHWSIIAHVKDSAGAAAE